MDEESQIPAIVVSQRGIGDKFSGLVCTFGPLMLPVSLNLNVWPATSHGAFHHLRVYQNLLGSAGRTVGLD